MGSLAFASRMELTAETTASKLVESPSRRKLQGATHFCADALLLWTPGSVIDVNFCVDERICEDIAHW